MYIASRRDVSDEDWAIGAFDRMGEVSVYVDSGIRSGLGWV